jgi:hypothetical protein
MGGRLSPTGTYSDYLCVTFDSCASLLTRIFIAKDFFSYGGHGENLASAEDL